MKHMTATGMSNGLRETFIGEAIGNGLLIRVDNQKLRLTDIGLDVAIENTSMELFEGEDFDPECDRLSYVLSKIYMRG